MRVVTIRQMPVELYKILKFEGLASSGAEAKACVASGQVTVNGHVETQKRKQIVAGDVLGYGENTFTIAVAAARDDLV